MFLWSQDDSLFLQSNWRTGEACRIVLAHLHVYAICISYHIISYIISYIYIYIYRYGNAHINNVAVIPKVSHHSINRSFHVSDAVVIYLGFVDVIKPRHRYSIIGRLLDNNACT